ncbi:ISAs1 family transposase [Sinomonas flava]|uniref:ISAs1 family transposase n=1 Tax=Sinomonas flava TaxID=496857 RepID=A0ABN3BLI6_9MICC
MPSSPIVPARAQLPEPSGLLAVFGTVPDPRHRRGVRHTLPSVLAVGAAAVLAYARSFAAIGEWVADQPGAALARLGVPDGRRPEESTIRRAFARLDADALDRAISAFLWTRTHRVQGRRVIAVDGKTVRGARTGATGAPHLVAAFDHGSGAVLGQLAVAAKSNEIPAVRDLLAAFDLTGTVVTVDAMHTQTDTAEFITATGGHYVVTVNGNQPSLHAACKALPWTEVPAHRTTETGHGRRATRTLKVIDAPAWVGFASAAQIAQLRRTVTRAGKKSVEVVCLITSAGHRQAPPETLAPWIRGHWGIENRLHWVRDVTYDEDRSQIRTGSAPQVMVTLRNTAISLLRLTGTSNIAKALRHHARHPGKAIEHLLTC